MKSVSYVNNTIFANCVFLMLVLGIGRVCWVYLFEGL